MPAKSEAQRKMLNARFGHAWVKEHHFDNAGKLPVRVKAKAKPKAMKPKRKKNSKKMNKGKCR